MTTPEREIATQKMKGFQYQYGDSPLPGYTIQRGIGRGGFGEVYYALSDSGREVAIKAVQGYEDIELRGVTHCMNLKSPHLVTIFDIRRNEEDRPFVIMEYVSGPSLRELIIDSPSGLGTQKAAFFLREIAKGLTFLHDRGIVHRDLKPGNIFYEDGYVKIGDYGLSKAISASQHSAQTITVGTVHYMAPEIGQGRYDRGVDIYALGIVLYEMLAGQVPFFGSSHGEILMKHLMDNPDMAGIDEPFASVIRKALAKDPADRYQSVQEMVEAVFGAEHVQESVSCFQPESLSMVADRVARKMPSTAAGSSLPHAPGLGPDKPAEQPSDDVGQQSSDFWKDVSDGIEKAFKTGSRRFTRGKEDDDSYVMLDDPMDLEIAAEYDVLKAPQRRHLLILIVLLSAAGAALAAGRNPQEAFFAGAIVVGVGSRAILFAARNLMDKLDGEKGLVSHLAFGGTAFLATGLASVAMIYGLGGIGSKLEYSVFFSILAFFLIDWPKRLSPYRKERVCLEYEVNTGLLALIIAVVTEATIFPIVSLMVGTSVAVQIASPFVPEAFRQSSRYKQARSRKRSGPPPVPAGRIRERVRERTQEIHRQSRERHERFAAARRASKQYPESPVAYAALRVALLFAAIGLGIASLLVLVIQASPAGAWLDAQRILVVTGIETIAWTWTIMLAWRSLVGPRGSWYVSLVRPMLVTLFLVTALTTGFSIFLNAGQLMPDEAWLHYAVILFAISGLLLVMTFPRKKRNGPDSDTEREFTDAPERVKQIPPNGSTGVSPRSRMWAILLAFVCFFTGLCGLQRFYAGKIGTGVLWLLTFGLFFIGQIYDIVMIATGKFKDAEGRKLDLWFAEDTLGNKPPQHTDQTDSDDETADQPEAAQPLEHCSTAGRWKSQLFIAAPAVAIGAVGIALGLFRALDIPIMIHAGLPDPQLGREITQTLGYSGWPDTVNTVSHVMSVLLIITAMVGLFVYRLPAGFAHSFRLVVGTLGLLGGIEMIREGFYHQTWYRISAEVFGKRPGLAFERFLHGFEVEAMLVAMLLLGGWALLLLLPARDHSRRGHSHTRRHAS